MPSSAGATVRARMPNSSHRPLAIESRGLEHRDRLLLALVGRPGGGLARARARTPAPRPWSPASPTLAHRADPRQPRDLLVGAARARGSRASSGDPVERRSEEPRGGAALDDRLHALLDASRGQQLVVARREPVGREDVAQQDREAGVHRVDGERPAAQLVDRADVGRGAQVEDRRALDLADDDEVVAVRVPGDEVVDRGEPEVVGAVHEPLRAARWTSGCGPPRPRSPAASNRPSASREHAEAGRDELDDAQAGHAGPRSMTSVSPLPTATTLVPQVIRTR